MATQFPFYKQYDAMDCGATCLRMIAKSYGRNYSLDSLRKKSYITREGASLLGLSEAAESIGFKTLGVRSSFKMLCEAPLPCIVHWMQNHFVVVYDIKISRSDRKQLEDDKFDWEKRKPKGFVYVADPGNGLIKYSVEEFLSCWLSSKSNGSDEGIALLLETTPDFYTIYDEKKDKMKFSFILQYLKPYKKLILQLFFGMLFGTMLQLIFFRRAGFAIPHNIIIRICNP